jgi:outer membrane protein assembly factor BamB
MTPEENTMRIMLSILLLASATLYAKDWPTFMGPDKTGISTEKIVNKFPESGPKLVWETEVGPGFAPVSVYKGAAYILDRKDDEFDAFRAIDEKTGKELWRVEHKVPGRLSYNGSRAAPTLIGNMAYALGGFGDLYAINLDKKEISWRVNIRETFGAEPPRWGYSQTPLVYEDLVIVAPMSDEIELVALNRKTGKTVWKTPAFGGRSYASPIMYEIEGTKMVVFVARNNTVGLDPKTGETLWKFEAYPTPIPIANATKVGENSLLISSGYGAGTVQLSLKKKGDGWDISEDYRFEYRGTQIHQPMVYDGHIYANFNNNENLSTFGKPKYDAEGIICLTMDGKTLWSSGMSPDVDRGGFIIVDGKILFMGGEDGILRMAKATPKGLDIISEAKIFETRSRDNQIWAPMIFANGKLFVRDHHKLKVFDLSS